MDATLDIDDEQFREQFGPDSRWALDLTRARDTGDTATLKRLWGTRDAAEQSARQRIADRQRIERLSQLPEAVEYDRETARLRAAGETDEADRREQGRVRFLELAGQRQWAREMEAAMDRRIAADMVRFNRIPEHLAVEGDAQVLAMRAKLMELDERRNDTAALAEKAKVEEQLRERLIELTMPAIRGGPIVPPGQPIQVQPQTALGELEDAKAAGDERAIARAELRIQREWVERNGSA